MNEEIFEIKNFNVINDDENYYVFRALNNGDHDDIESGITTEDGVIQRIRTDRERWEDEHGIRARFSSGDEISLEEIWAHIKANHIKETNCISLSGNTNVSVNYGKYYHEEYIMIKVPKNRPSQLIVAGQYMIKELSKKIDEIIQTLPEDSEILKMIEEIDRDSEEFITTLFHGPKTGKKPNYTSQSQQFERRVSISGRFSKKEYFSPEQQKEYNKILAKLTVLEMNGKAQRIIERTSGNMSLLSTIGLAFASGELIHYNAIQKDEFIQVSKEMMDMLSLLQQAKHSELLNPEKVHEFEKRVIHFVSSNPNYKLEISPKKYMEDLSVEDVYRITGGRVEFEKAKKVFEFVLGLKTSRLQNFEYVKFISELFNKENEFDEIIEYIEKNGFIVDKDITCRANGEGVQIAESVNVGIGTDSRKFVSREEEQRIFDKIISLNEEEVSKENDLEIIYEEILKGLLNESLEKSENRYFAEAIIDSIDYSKIYKNAISEKRKSMLSEDRELLIKKIESADCKRLYNAFKNAGVSHKDISGYIINLLMNNGYKGYSFEELSRAEDLDEIISVNVKNTMLKNKIVPFRLDELLGIRDDVNEIEGIEGIDIIDLHLRDYQKEVVENLAKIYQDKRFAGVILPTGAGKSFIAMAQMLKNKDKNIVYFAPQIEILNQIKRHILKYILGLQVLTEKEIKELNGKPAPAGKIYPKDIDDHISKVFPHLKMYCYQSLSGRNEETKEKELREILANSDADMLIFDELHRTGADSWEPLVQKLITKNKKAKILGITATPIRDVDKKDMMEQLARFSGDYTEEEVINGKYLAKQMSLVDAIQEHLVVEPKIVAFNYTLFESDEYKAVKNMYNNEKDPEKKSRLKEILEQMNTIVNDMSDIQEMIEKEENSDRKKQLEIMLENAKQARKETDAKRTQGIGEVIKANIVKKDGRYIVFLPQNNTKLSSEEYVLQEIEKVKEYLKDIDDFPEVDYILSSRKKSDNMKAISDFETSDSEHIKLLFAIDMLNEGIHIDGINGEIMLRRIGEGSRILYLQQLGRVIFSLDPENPISEDELPIVFDVYNNYIAQNMNRAVNKKSVTSDFQRLQSILTWIDKHGYIPDINSEEISEARKAITLKRLQRKYMKFKQYQQNLYEALKSKYSQREIYEIEQILNLLDSINLFEMEIPDRIIPPGEKDLSEVQLFKVTGSQKKFLELFKEATQVTKGKNSFGIAFRIKRVLSVLQILEENGLDINNETIPEGYTLRDVLNQFPQDIREEIIEELDETTTIDLDYEIGIEYNTAKAAFCESGKATTFLDYDVKDLNRCGIFEKTPSSYFKNGKPVTILDGEFIIAGRKQFRGLNIKTGKYEDEYGCTIKECNSRRFDRFGYYWEQQIEETRGANGRTVKKAILKRTNRKYDDRGFNREYLHRNGTYYDDDGFDINDIHKDTGKPYNLKFYTREGYFVDVKDDGTYEILRSKYSPYLWNENGINKITNSRYDEFGFDIDKKFKNGKNYNERYLNRDGYFVIVDKDTGEETVTDKPYDKRHFTLEGYWVDVKEDGTYVVTDKKYNPDRWDVNGNYVDEVDGKDVFTNKPYNKNHFTEDNCWVNVIDDNNYEVTDKKEESPTTSSGVVINYYITDKETGKKIGFIDKEVAEFVESEMSKRGYCEDDGIRIKKLNDAISKELKFNSEVASILDKANMRAPNIKKELMPRLRQLLKEIDDGKKQLEELRKNLSKIDNRKINFLTREVNGKIMEANRLKKEIIARQEKEKEEAEKRKQKAQEKKAEAEKFIEKMEKRIRKKNGQAIGGDDDE